MESEKDSHEVNQVRPSLGLLGEAGELLGLFICFFF